ncbi:MAG: hypothetical protein GX221_06060 [Candidatus Riflebacteria bacterium]|nr:hypothetical protein [Candidatus Riflebacteria bacterium]
MNTTAVPLSENEKLSEKKFFIYFLLSMLFFSLLLFRNIAEQNLPEDDALRHAAHSLHERSDSEILLMRSEYTFDHNFGWHCFLRGIRKLFNFNQRQVLYFSIIFLYLLFHVAGIISSPHPMAWYFSFTLASCFFLVYAPNLTIGRPFMVSTSAIILLLRLWCVDKEKIAFKHLLTASFIILLAVCWLHGSWYLFLLFPLSFALAGRLKDSVSLLLLLLAAAIAAGVFSGDAAGYFNFHFNVTKKIFAERALDKQLVTEFQPLQSFWRHIFFVVVLFIPMLALKSLDWRKLYKDPAFIMWFISYLGAYKVSRFWRDWAVPALLFWLAWQFYALYPKFTVLKNKKLMAFLIAFLGLFTWVVNSPEKSLSLKPLPAKEVGCDFSSPENISWKPGTDGIVYALEMGVYYSNYFRYPFGDWKYYLGFEQEVMPEENLKLMREISGNFTADNLKKWINIMKPADRLIFSKEYFDNYFVTSSEQKNPLEIDTLAWKKIGEYYVGKLK